MTIVVTFLKGFLIAAGTILSFFALIFTLAALADVCDKRLQARGYSSSDSHFLIVSVTITLMLSTMGGLFAIAIQRHQ